MKKPSQHIRIIDHITTQYTSDPEHLWAKYPEYTVFRNARTKKWFALIMNVPANRIGMRGDDSVYIIDLHIPPAFVSTILPDNMFMPGYHMNKKTWTTIVLDDRLSDEKIIPLINASFTSTGLNRPHQA